MFLQNAIFLLIFFLYSQINQVTACTRLKITILMLMVTAFKFIGILFYLVLVLNFILLCSEDTVITTLQTKSVFVIQVSVVFCVPAVHSIFIVLI